MQACDFCLLLEEKIPQGLKIWTCVAMLFFCASSSALAQGSPPLITDDTGTPGNNKWEINVGGTSELRHPDERQFETPILDMNYGIGENIELSYQLPLLLTANRDEPSLMGLGDSVVGTKWRFLDEDKEDVSVSVYPQFTFNNPTSSVRRGLVAADQQFFLPLELEKTIGPLDLNFEAGHGFHFNAPDEWDFGVVAGHSFGDFELMGEIHGAALDHFQQDDLVVNVGARYQISKDYALLLSVGRSIHTDNTPRATFLSYTGIQFIF
jgi:hypothetical protein